MPENSQNFSQPDLFDKDDFKIIQDENQPCDIEKQYPEGQLANEG